ncbi:MAG: NUDIX domain-containing protein [Alcanivorax sp.]|nr:NUDIX domain-containing protein [Alcanivorax sp.]
MSSEDRCYELVRETTVFKGYFEVKRFSVRHSLYDGGWSEELEREIFVRGNCVAVLPYDPVRDQVVLIEQFRAGAVDDADGPWLIECVAGVIEEGESQQQVAMRECEEEAGCSIEQLQLISHYYVSPGGTSEHCSLYCGFVDSEGVAGIHGLADENEDIRVMVVDVEEAYAWVRAGKIRSSATIIALQWLELNQARLDQ